jgi:hypothetical protein
MIRVFTNRDAFSLIPLKKSTTIRRRGAQFTVVRAQKPPQVDRTTGFIESDNTVSKTSEISSRFCVLSSLRFRSKNFKRKRKSSALDRSSRRRRTTTAFFWFVSKDDVESIAREVVPLSHVSVPRISRSIGKR